MFPPDGEYQASEALQRHLGGGEPNLTARCPASPKFPPKSGGGSDEQERQHRTFSEQARSSLKEEEDALVWQDPQGLQAEVD